MFAGEIVDAALAGLERGEQMTIPSPPDAADDPFAHARHSSTPPFTRPRPAQAAAAGRPTTLKS
jgi:hypothetical protein